MFVELPQNVVLMTAGAFFIGWLLATISSSIGSRFRARKRDPRDDRIRSLVAELRIARSDVETAREKVEALKSELKEAAEAAEKRDNVISQQQLRIEAGARDLKESVIKTRELRAELSDRATENLKSEVKLREVETELSVARASTDMITTGLLDYSFTADSEDDDNKDVAEAK